jgi:ketosteroid isomerase-like protein
LTPATADLVEQMNAFFDAMSRDDRAGAIEVIERAIHSDCEMTSVIGGGVEGRRYQGTEGLESFVEDLLGSFEVTYRDRVFESVPGALLCLAQVDLKGRESGAELVQPVGLVVQFEDGSIRRIDTYPSHDEARLEVESLRA